MDKKTLSAELIRIKARLAEYYEPDDARSWLQSPHPQLGGQRPCDLLEDGRLKDVLEVIERLENSVYL